MWRDGAGRRSKNPDLARCAGQNEGGTCLIRQESSKKSAPFVEDHLSVWRGAWPAYHESRGYHLEIDPGARVITPCKIYGIQMGHEWRYGSVRRRTFDWFNRIQVLSSLGGGRPATGPRRGHRGGHLQHNCSGAAAYWRPSPAAAWRPLDGGGRSAPLKLTTLGRKQPRAAGERHVRGAPAATSASTPDPPPSGVGTNQMNAGFVSFSSGRR